VNTTAARTRALLSAVPAGPAPAALTERRGPWQAFPSLPVGGTALTREETAAALFEAETDCYGMPGLTTDTLYEITGRQVRSMTPDDLAALTDDFAALDSGEFPEVGQCRWYAYRLHLSFWYLAARARPMTTGEAAAALHLSDWQRAAGRGPAGPRELGRWVRQGAARVPATVLMTLGTALTAEHARTGPQVPAWLHERLLPGYARRRACFHLIRSDARVPAPLIVRPDAGGYAVGTTPPAGPGNVWARPLRAGW
jgi:hypothetical protein